MALTLTGTYTYRIDLCYKNAQGEEVRSHSLLKEVSLVGTEDRVNLTWESVLTVRENAYFLVFRTSMVDGVPTTTFNLVNSRDPSDAAFILNDQSLEDFTYTDTLSDADALARELHPGNAGFSWLQPFSAPACEILAAGRDRLWLAGGELLPGQIAPSRLFEPGEVPAFNANIYRQVDRSDQPLTAIGFVGDIGVLFRRNSAYVLDGDGPDNVSQGNWEAPRLCLADTGAVSQHSLVLTTPGLLFQSPAGFRLLGPGGQLSPVGTPVDTLARTFEVAGAVSVADDQEVRWYGPTGTIVLNYLDGAWSTWTVKSRGAVVNPATGRAILFSGSDFLVETEGLWTDGDRTYEHRLRFPWLHAGNLGDFYRIRQIAGFGTHDPDQPHKVLMELYYDERDFPEETFEWDVPDDSENTDTWGAATWGGGVWGDTSATTNGLRDSVWRWRRDPRIQKCSVFSPVISDAGSNGPGFTLTALGLKLARKAGLDRMPRVTGGTNTYR